MKDSQNSLKLNNLNPVKEYYWFNNLNLSSIYDSYKPKLKGFQEIRQDIDFDRKNITDSDYIKDYHNKIIKEYSPLEDYNQESKIHVNTEESYIQKDSIITDTTRGFSKGYTEPKETKSKKGFIGTILAIIGLVLIKAKGIAAFFFVKVLPIIGNLLAPIIHFKSLMIMVGSMVGTILLYAAFFKLELAVGLVILIFIHEAGHAIMIASRGIKAGLPVFIPFFGAFIAIKDIPKDVLTEAQIAIGGPFLGGIGAFAMLIMYAFTDSLVWLYLAHIGFMLNLFNLTPISPLDGGRIVSIISRKMWFLGFIVLLGLTIMFKTPVLILVLVFSFFNLIKPPQHKESYYKSSNLAKAAFTAAYFAMVVMLGFCAYETAMMLGEKAPS